MDESSAPAGDDALHVAARSGDTGAVASLLAGPDAGQLVRKRDAHERTALHLACFGNHAAVVAQLVGAGASVNATAKAGFSALHFAAQAGAAEACEALLVCGAKPSVWEARKKLTPLHLAAMKGNAACVASLLAHGADPISRSKRGETPFDLGGAHAGVAQALREFLEAQQRSAAASRRSNEEEEEAVAAAAAAATVTAVGGVAKAAAPDAGATEPTARPAAAAGDPDGSAPAATVAQEAGESEPCNKPGEDLAAATATTAAAPAEAAVAASGEPPAKRTKPDKKKEKRKGFGLSLSHLEDGDVPF